MAFKRRTDFDIMGNILQECHDKPLFKSQIMYRANLSFRQLEVYLERLMKTGLLIKQIEGSRVIYATTKKGMEFLATLGHLRRLIDIKSTSNKSWVKNHEP